MHNIGDYIKCLLIMNKNSTDNTNIIYETINEETLNHYTTVIKTRRFISPRELCQLKKLT